VTTDGTFQLVEQAAAGVDPADQPTYRRFFFDPVSGKLSFKNSANNTTEVGGGGGGLTPTAVKIEDYTAVAGELVVVDGTVAVLIGAPAAPSLNQRFGVMTVGQSGNEAVTKISGNGANVVYQGTAVGTRGFSGIGFRADFYFDGTEWQYESGNLEPLLAVKFSRRESVPAPGTAVTFFSLDPTPITNGDTDLRAEVDIHGRDSFDGKILAKGQVLFEWDNDPLNVKYVRWIVFEPGLLPGFAVTIYVAANVIKLDISHTDAVEGADVTVDARIYTDRLADVTPP
jgi:hypothetical protein